MTLLFSRVWDFFPSKGAHPPCSPFFPGNTALLGGGKGTMIVDKSSDKALFSEGGGTHDMCGICLVLFLARI